MRMSSRCFVDFPREDGTRQPLGFAQPYAVRVADRPDEVIPLLRTIEQAAQEGSWAVGILAYEAALAFDPAFVAHPPRPGWPLAAFALFSAPDIIEHERQGFSCSPWQANVSREAFDDAVESIRRDIAGGLYYQANYTIRLTPFSRAILGLYFTLYARLSLEAMRFIWTMGIGRSPPAHQNCFLLLMRQHGALLPAR